MLFIFSNSLLVKPCSLAIFRLTSGYLIFSKAAKTISDRFIALYKGKDYPSPNDILNTNHKTLRSVGLSNAKANYIKNISQAFLDGTVDYKNLNQNLHFLH